MTADAGRIDALVASVVEAHPAPARVEDLDVALRRTVTRAAAAAGITPAAFWAAAVGGADASRTALDEAREIAREVRQ